MNKILIVLPNDNLGGAEQFLKMLASYYVKKGFEVDVYFIKSKLSGAWDDLIEDSVALHFTNFKSEKFGIFALLFRLLRTKKVNYDLMFTSHVHVNSFVSTLRRLRVIKANNHVARESSSTFQRYKGLKLLFTKFFYKFNYKEIDLLICQTESMYQQLTDALPSLHRKLNIEVIPNPIDLTKFEQSKNDCVVLESNFIVSAGRLINEKGFDILIKSFFDLQKKHPDLHLLILGEGKLRVTLEAQIKKLNLENKVHLKGFVENVYPYFKKAKLCVVSSRIEGFPNVLLQMMSQNSRVVSTLCAGGIDQLKGVLSCSPENSKDLANIMEEALNQNSDNNESYFKDELESRTIERFVQKVCACLGLKKGVGV